MEPLEALRVIEDLEDPVEVAEACENLREWLNNGGFEPDWTLYPKGTERFQRLEAAYRMFREWAPISLCSPDKKKGGTE